MLVLRAGVGTPRRGIFSGSTGAGSGVDGFGAKAGEYGRGEAVGVYPSHVSARRDDDDDEAGCCCSAFSDGESEHVGDEETWSAKNV